MAYIKQGSTIHQTDEKSIMYFEKLPVGNYVIKYNDFTGVFFFEETDEFVLPSRFYGDIQHKTERIINTFEDRSGNTGILLAGEKGSGKSLLAKNLCVKLGDMGIPTLIVNSAFVGDGFNTFLQNVHQPVIVLFDEFEKVYDNDDNDDQAKMLSLFDGVFSSKKLFIFTCNDKYKIDRNMINRPGRVYYHIEYDGLDESFIDEYCDANFHNDDAREKIKEYARLFSPLNFDMLQSIVEEYNRYGGDISEALSMLNAKIENNNSVKFECRIVFDGVELDIDDKTITTNPLDVGFSWMYYVGCKEGDLSKISICSDPDTSSKFVDGEFRTSFKFEDLVRFDSTSNEIVYTNPAGFTLYLKQKRASKRSYIPF